MSMIQEGRLCIRFGALCEPLAKQVRNIGLMLDPGRADVLQACHDSIVRLRLQGILSEAESHKANRRLFKAVRGAVQVEREP